jgi:hypothetical protein
MSASKANVPAGAFIGTCFDKLFDNNHAEQIQKPGLISGEEVMVVQSHVLSSSTYQI